MTRRDKTRGSRPQNVGYRYWNVVGDGFAPPSVEALHWSGMSGAGELGHLISPHGYGSWESGWQRATCVRCSTAAGDDCSCGVAFFPSLMQLATYLLPTCHYPDQADLTEAVHYSIAVGRIETRGEWVPDGPAKLGGHRVLEARIARLWISPAALRTPVQLMDEYGVTVTQGAGSYDSWLLSLVPPKDRVVLASVAARAHAAANP